MQVFCVKAVLLLIPLLQRIGAWDPELRAGAGVAFTPVDEVNVAASDWEHSIMIPMLNITQFNLTIPPVACYKGDYDCRRITQIITLLHRRKSRAEKRMENLLGMIKNLLPREIPSRKNKGRSSRAPLAFIGDLSNILFGTATTKQLAAVEEHMTRYEERQELDQHAISTLQDRLSSFADIADNRMKVAMQLMARNHEYLTRVKDILIELETNETALSAKFQTLAFVVRYSVIYGDVISSVESYLLAWLRSTNVLLSNKLPLELMPVSQLRLVLAKVSSDLKKTYPSFELSHKGPAYYYSTARTFSLRTRKYLVIHIQLPIQARNTHFKLYNVLSFGLPVNATAKMYTKITNLPRFFGISDDRHSYIVIDDMAYSTCQGQLLSSCVKGLPIFDKSQASCISALFYDDSYSIIEQCDVLYSSKSPGNNIVNLGGNKFLVSSKEDDDTWMSQCGGEPPVRVEPCSFCVITLKCNCGLTTRHFTVSPILSNCETTMDRVTRLYPANIPAALLLGREKDVEALSTDRLYSKIPQVKLPNLDRMDHEWEEVITSEDTYSSDFKKLAKAVKADKKLYSSRADYLRSKMTSMPFKYVEIGSYVIYPVVTVSVLLTVCLYVKYRRLAAVVTALQLVNRANAAGLNVVHDQLALDLSRTTEIIEREVTFEIVMEWMVTGVIIYLAVRYLLCDSWYLFGRRIVRTNMAAWSAPRLSAEILVEIYQDSGSSLILHLGMVAPSFWEEVKAVTELGVVKVTGYGPMAVITVQYKEGLTCSKFLINRVLACKLFNNVLSQLCQNQGQLRTEFWLVHNTSCQKLPSSQIPPTNLCQTRPEHGEFSRCYPSLDCG